jgi:hypothetical protein
MYGPNTEVLVKMTKIWTCLNRRKRCQKFDCSMTYGAQSEGGGGIEIILNREII